MTRKAMAKYGAESLLRHAREAKRLEIERLARAEAELLALEAAIDELLLQYADAAAKYAEAATLVAFDPELCGKYSGEASAALLACG